MKVISCVVVLSVSILTGCLGGGSQSDNSHSADSKQDSVPVHSDEGQYKPVPPVDYREPSYTKLNYYGHYISSTNASVVFSDVDNFYTLDNLLISELDGSLYFLGEDSNLPVKRRGVGVVFEKNELPGSDVNDLVNPILEELKTSYDFVLVNVGTGPIPIGNTVTGKFILRLQEVEHLTNVINMVLVQSSIIGFDVNRAQLPAATDVDPESSEFHMYLTISEVAPGRYVHILSIGKYERLFTNVGLNSLHDGTNILR